MKEVEKAKKSNARAFGQNFMQDLAALVTLATLNQDVALQSREARADLQRTFLFELMTLLQACEPNTPISSEMLMVLAEAKVRYQPKMARAETLDEKIAVLNALIFDEWQLATAPAFAPFYHIPLIKTLFDQRSLESVGSNGVNSALILYFAAEWDLPIYLLNFPSQLILVVMDEAQTFYLDPTTGARLSEQILSKWLEGDEGFGAQLSDVNLLPESRLHVQQLAKQYLKGFLLKRALWGYAYQIIQFEITQEQDNPYLIRERAALLAAMGCIQAAKADFDAFLEACPDDSSNKEIKREMQRLEKMVEQHRFH